MNRDGLRQYCLSFPHATEDIQWGNDLLFRIGGKIFAGTSLTPDPEFQVSLKVTPEEFADLTEKEGIHPAPYVARYHWISIEKSDALPTAELKQLIGNSYNLVFKKLPAKTRKELK